MSDSEIPVVAIIGRPNVGKSALFNRLLSRRQAIVFDRPGVTRDRIYAECEWNGRTFSLCDTGGMDPQDPDVLRRQVYEQAQTAIREADVLMLTVDGQYGPHPLDHEIARILRPSGKPVMLVVNKAESLGVEADRFAFYELGVGDPICVSAMHGSMTGDLLDLLVELLPEEKTRMEREEISVALVGRPNVGKSSLLNRLMGEERSVVHHEAGTTRDAVDTMLEHDGQAIRLVDTAGLRKKGNVDDEIEYYSNIRALNALKRSQVGILVLDGTDTVAAQDQRIAGEIQEAEIAAVIVVNKWDLVAAGQNPPEKQRRRDAFVKSISAELDFLSFAPVLYVSALTGEETDDILAAALDVHEQWTKRIETSTVNLVIREAVALNPAPSYKGKTLKVLYVSQQKTKPPTFVFKVNSTKLIHFSYRRYLENQLRKAFGFVGAPIVLKFVSE